MFFLPYFLVATGNQFRVKNVQKLNCFIFIRRYWLCHMKNIEFTNPPMPEGKGKAIFGV